MYTNCKLCRSTIKLINKTLNIVQGEECKLIFCKKEFTQDEFNTLYDELYNKMQNSHYSHHLKHEFKNLKIGVIPNIGWNRKRVIDKFTKATNSVIEVGSGVGLIASYLKSIGVTDYTGIELDNDTFKKSKGLGLNTINGDFSLMENIDKNVDIVMLWEVLEHLQDMKLFLDLSYKKLKNDGILMFSVPNFDKIKNYPNSEKIDFIYQDNPPIHINFFTKKNIKTILNYAGFEVTYLYVKKMPYFSPFTREYYKMLFKAILGLYHGSSLFVVARKIE